ncbi:MAG: hypothetical protein JSU63_19090 [Phycisphaerales bacterium]|nr:MAG: hypothetical protein JSU63_19090 [Phycisphaerales bacterium]
MRKIAVVGVGKLGLSLAQVAASHGWKVCIADVDEERLRQAAPEIARGLVHLLETGWIDRDRYENARENIHICDIHEIKETADVEVAVEAVQEDLPVKRQVLADLDASTPTPVLLATTVALLSVTDIAARLGDPSRVVGMHFPHPSTGVELVEVVAGKRSDKSRVDSAVRVARGWGMTPVVVQDAPGFIVNRLSQAFILEALRLLDEGVGAINEIDAVMCTHGKFETGPFRLLDEEGLDISLAVGTSIWERMGRPAGLAPHASQKRLVAMGYSGRSSGRGFYSYEYEAPVPALPVDRKSFELSPLLSDAMLNFSVKAGAATAGSTEQYIFCRILGTVINEAGRIYDEDVARPGDIDLAMAKGMKFPKGPLEWADEIGHRTVRGTLKALNSGMTDERFAPAPLFANAD